MLNQARLISEQLIAWRRDFHRHPELGFQEQRTSQRVAQILGDLGCRVRTGIGRTGVVAELGQGSPIVALRADMDALPILEANRTSYTSTNPGVMHACGHDAHTAMLLGVAALLAKQDLPGTVRFLFQPAEEVADDEGLSGAPRMIQDGAMQDVQAVLALHVSSYVSVGKIQIASGPSSGGVDSFRGVIYGKGGHGARPHETVDPFVITAHVILLLNNIISRRLNPFDVAVVSIGSVHGGQAENVIPGQVEINGTIRYMSDHVQQKVHREIRHAFDVARTLGGNYKLEFEIGTPPMINDPRAVDLISQAASRILGSENVLPHEDSLGAEDFGCFSLLAPGAMFNLGCKFEGDERQHHNPLFDVNEESLPYGVAILAQSVLDYLKQGGFSTL